MPALLAWACDLSFNTGFLRTSGRGQVFVHVFFCVLMKARFASQVAARKNIAHEYQVLQQRTWQYAL